MFGNLLKIPESLNKEGLECSHCIITFLFLFSKKCENIFHMAKERKMRKKNNRRIDWHLENNIKPGRTEKMKATCFLGGARPLVTDHDIYEGAEQFSGAWNFFLTFRLCMSFLVGNSLCNNFFNVNAQNNDSRKLLLVVFFPWHDIFQQFLLCKNLFGNHPATSQKIMVRPLVHVLHQGFCCFLRDLIFWGGKK